MSALWVLSLLVSSVLPAGSASAPSEGVTADAHRPRASSVEATRAEVPAPAMAVPPTTVPLAFVANQGQGPEEIRFHARATGHDIVMTDREVVLARRSGVGGAAPSILRLSWNAPSSGAESAGGAEKGSASIRTPTGSRRLPGVAHFYQGKDPSSWITGVPTYGTITYPEIYPGIDLDLGGDSGELKSELRVRPGASPDAIALRYDGVGPPELDDDGALILPAEGGAWRESPPVIFQDIDGERRFVSGAYRILADGRVGFDVGAYDSEHPLVIDPVLHWSTYLGGSEVDVATSLAVAPGGKVVVAGITRSVDFPIVGWAAQDVKAGANNGADEAFDFFVTKFSQDGHHVLFSTYLGGRYRELAPDVATDAYGNAYVSGWTVSDDFPTTPGAFGPTPFGVGASATTSRDDVAVFRLDPWGFLRWSTYLGGSGDDESGDIDVDPQGRPCVTGGTFSNDFPRTQGSFAGSWDTFVTCFTPWGWPYESVILGGSGFDAGRAIDVGTGQVWVASESDGVATSPGCRTASGGRDAAVALLGPSSSPWPVLVQTHLGGAGNEVPQAIDVQGNRVFLGGSTDSDATSFPLFPVTPPGALDSTFDGPREGFAAAIDFPALPASSSGPCNIRYSTYLGGPGVDEVRGLRAWPSGLAWVGGLAGSDFSPVWPLPSGASDGFLLMLSANGDRAYRSCLLGGSDADSVNDLALRFGFRPCVAGQTASSDFPVSWPYDPTWNGMVDAWVGSWRGFFFSGFDHLTHGGTVLTPFEGRVRVRGVAPGGGLWIPVSDADGFGSQVEFETALPEGATLLGTITGEAGDASRVLARLGFEQSAEGLAVTPDFDGLGAGSYTLELFRDGTRVHVEEGVDGLAGLTSVVPGRPCDLELFGSGSLSFGACLGASFRTASGTEVEADAVVMTAESPVHAAGRVRVVELEAAGFEGFDLVGEQLFLEGLRHRALGTASLVSGGGRLGLAQEEPNGRGGVEIELGAVEEWELDLGSGGPPPQPGERLTFGLDASVVGADALAAEKAALADAASIELEAIDGATSVAFDFSGLGATTYTVELLLGGDVVAQRVAVLGPGALLSGPGWLDCWPRARIENGVLVASVSAPSPMAMALPDGPTVLADTVRARPTPGQAAASVLSIDRLRAESDSIEHWTIDRLDIVPIPVSPPPNPIFADGFESGSAAAWGAVSP